jgi:hypothetical protein
VYHHYVGGKYFRELGYTDLYACTVVADQQDGFAIPPAQRPVRDLATGGVRTAADVLAREPGCAARFGPARWDAFRADVAWFRARTPPRQWAQTLTDHGMNATPAWTILGTWLAGAGPVGEARVRAVALADPLLLAAAWAALFWGFGWRPACVALVFWGTNAPAQASWTAGAFLRQDWFAASAFGLALLRRGLPAAGGAALTAAALLRVFPAFLVAAVGLRGLATWARRRSRGPALADRRFVLGCLAAAVAGVAVSTAVAGRLDAWPAFAANSRRHLDTPLVNFMGLPTVLAFDPSTSLRRTKDLAAPDPYAAWHAAVRERLAARAPLRWGAALAFAALLLAAVRREPRWSAAVLGVGLAVIAAPIGCYYYAMLAFYGLLAEERPWAGALLLGLAAATVALTSTALREEEVYVAQSAACAAYVVAVTAAIAWSGRRAAPAREAAPA